MFLDRLGESLNDRIIILMCGYMTTFFSLLFSIFYIFIKLRYVLVHVVNFHFRFDILSTRFFLT